MIMQLNLKSVIIKIDFFYYYNLLPKKSNRNMFETLRKVYERHTGIAASPYNDNFIIDLFLLPRKIFIKLIPHIKNAKSDFIIMCETGLLLELCISPRKYEEYCSKLGKIRSGILVNPSLWKVLIYYPQHFTAFNFIMNNWELFYPTFPDFMAAILLELLLYSSDGFVGAMPSNNKACAVLRRFLKRNDVIWYINTFNGNTYGPKFLQVEWSRTWSYMYKPFKSFLINFDTDHRFKIYNVDVFFQVFLDNVDMFKRMFYIYRDNIIINSNSIMSICISDGHYEIYQFLYEYGYKLEYEPLYEDSFLFAKLIMETDLMYTIEYIFPLKKKQIDILIKETIRTKYMPGLCKILARNEEYNSEHQSSFINLFTTRMSALLSVKN